MVFEAFFVTKGVGQNDLSAINAFDEALTEARIADCNLVKVSSILPENPQRLVEIPEIPIGEIVFCVMARLDGKKGETVCAGLGWAIGIRKADGRRHGMVLEATSHGTEHELKHDLMKGLKDLASRRNFTIEEHGIETSYLPQISRGHGSAIVVLVYRHLPVAET